MEAKIYSIGEAQYRIIEKENNSGKKFYFLQRALYGFHYYKRHKLFFWKKYLHHSEIEWVYLFNDDKKGQYSNDYFDCLMTKNYRGEDLPKIDLNNHLDKARNSREEAIQLMHEHIGWVKWLQIKKKELEEEEESKKLNDEKEEIIHLHDLDGKIKSSYEVMKKETIYDDKTKQDTSKEV